MPTIRAMRLLNAIKAGTTTGAQLQTLLTADPGRLAEFNVLLGMRGQMRRMAASSTAMTAVAASSTAMAAVIASSTAMTAVNANDQAVRIWMLAGTNQVWSNFASVRKPLFDPAHLLDRWVVWLRRRAKPCCSVKRPVLT